MKIRYMGTAALERIPAVFCNCETCQRAMAAGGRNIMTRSQALIDDRLLIETDCPYLAPVPVRSKRNYSGYMRHTAEFMAERRGMDVKTLCELTTANAERFYRL